MLENLEEIRALGEGAAVCRWRGARLQSIYNMGLTELRGEAAALDVEMPQHAPNRDQLINAIAAQAGEARASIITTGVLELLDDDEGGLLVYERDSYRIKALSAYVPQSLIEVYGLKRGHIIEAQLHPKRAEESLPLCRVCCGRSWTVSRRR